MYFLKKCFKTFILTFREFKEDIQMKSDHTCEFIMVLCIVVGKIKASQGCTHPDPWNL